jgi:hypothetical protein
LLIVDTGFSSNPSELQILLRGNDEAKKLDTLRYHGSLDYSEIQKKKRCSLLLLVSALTCQNRSELQLLLSGNDEAEKLDTLRYHGLVGYSVDTQSPQSDQRLTTPRLNTEEGI